MIKPEEDGQQKGKGDRNEDVAHGDVPEVDEPASLLHGRHEGDARRQRLERDVLHLAHMHEAGEEDHGQRSAIVLEEDAHGVAEQAAPAELAADIGDGEDEQGHDNGQVEGLIVAEDLEDLDALLEVDEGDVEAEDIAGEAGHVAQPVARVRDGQNPVEHERPAGGSKSAPRSRKQTAQKRRTASPTHMPIQHINAR